MASASSRLATGEGAPWSKLPDEVVERVLSFLPLPTLCRLRTVCKGWNDLLCGPSFHGLYEDRCREVIFLTRFKLTDEREMPSHTKVQRRLQGTTCFLDLAERRWYSIALSCDPGLPTRALAVGDGLVATSWCEGDDDHGNHAWVKISNPFLNRTEIRKAPFFKLTSGLDDDELPTLAVATDRVSCSSRVFLMDNCRYIPAGGGSRQFLWIHESGRWHLARHPANPKHDGATNPRPTLEKNKITTAMSAVVFRGDLYAILSPFASDVCFVMKYEYEKDTWTVIRDDAPNQSAHP